MTDAELRTLYTKVCKSQVTGSPSPQQRAFLINRILRDSTSKSLASHLSSLSAASNTASPNAASSSQMTTTVAKLVPEPIAPAVIEAKNGGKSQWWLGPRVPIDVWCQMSMEYEAATQRLSLVLKGPLYHDLITEIRQDKTQFGDSPQITILRPNTRIYTDGNDKIVSPIPDELLGCLLVRSPPVSSDRPNFVSFVLKEDCWVYVLQREGDLVYPWLPRDFVLTAMRVPVDGWSSEPPATERLAVWKSKWPRKAKETVTCGQAADVFSVVSRRYLIACTPVMKRKIARSTVSCDSQIWFPLEGTLANKGKQTKFTQKSTKTLTNQNQQLSKEALKELVTRLPPSTAAFAPSSFPSDLVPPEVILFDNVRSEGTACEFVKYVSEPGLPRAVMVKATSPASAFTCGDTLVVTELGEFLRCTRRVYSLGDKVSALWRANSRYYGAKIDALNQDGTYSVKFDDGDHDCSLPESLIQPSKDAPPRAADMRCRGLFKVCPAFSQTAQVMNYLLNTDDTSGRRLIGMFVAVVTDESRSWLGRFISFDKQSRQLCVRFGNFAQYLIDHRGFVVDRQYAEIGGLEKGDRVLAIQLGTYIDIESPIQNTQLAAAVIVPVPVPLSAPATNSVPPGAEDHRVLGCQSIFPYLPEPRRGQMSAASETGTHVVTIKLHGPSRVVGIGFSCSGPAVPKTIAVEIGHSPDEFYHITTHRDLKAPVTGRFSCILPVVSEELEAEEAIASFVKITCTGSDKLLLGPLTVIGNLLESEKLAQRAMPVYRDPVWNLQPSSVGLFEFLTKSGREESVEVKCSGLVSGVVADLLTGFVTKDKGPFLSTNRAYSWVDFALPSTLLFQCTGYAVREDTIHRLTAWQLLGSRDGQTWEVLHQVQRVLPAGLKAKGKKEIFFVNSADEATRPLEVFPRYRVLATGPCACSADGSCKSIAFSQIELFGHLRYSITLRRNWVPANQIPRPESGTVSPIVLVEHDHNHPMYWSEISKIAVKSSPKENRLTSLTVTLRNGYETTVVQPSAPNEVLTEKTVSLKPGEWVSNFETWSGLNKLHGIRLTIVIPGKDSAVSELLGSDDGQRESFSLKIGSEPALPLIGISDVSNLPDGLLLHFGVPATWQANSKSLLQPLSVRRESRLIDLWANPCRSLQLQILQQTARPTDLTLRRQTGRASLTGSGLVVAPPTTQELTTLSLASSLITDTKIQSEDKTLRLGLGPAASIGCDPDSLDPDKQAFVVTCFVQTTKDTGVMRLVTKRAIGEDTNWYSLMLTNGAPCLELGPTVSCRASNSIADGSWHFIQASREVSAAPSLPEETIVQDVQDLSTADCPCENVNSIPGAWLGLRYSVLMSSGSVPTWKTLNNPHFELHETKSAHRQYVVCDLGERRAVSHIYIAGGPSTMRSTLAGVKVQVADSLTTWNNVTTLTESKVGNIFKITVKCVFRYCRLFRDEYGGIGLLQLVFFPPRAELFAGSTHVQTLRLYVDGELQAMVEDPCRATKEQEVGNTLALSNTGVLEVGGWSGDRLEAMSLGGRGFTVGDSVMAFWRNSSNDYPAKIAKHNGDGTFGIVDDDSFEPALGAEKLRPAIFAAYRESPEHYLQLFTGFHGAIRHVRMDKGTTLTDAKALKDYRDIRTILFEEGVLEVRCEDELSDSPRTVQESRVVYSGVQLRPGNGPFRLSSLSASSLFVGEIRDLKLQWKGDEEKHRCGLPLCLDEFDGRIPTSALSGDKKQGRSSQIKTDLPFYAGTLENCQYFKVSMYLQLGPPLDRKQKKKSDDDEDENSQSTGQTIVAAAMWRGRTPGFVVELRPEGWQPNSEDNKAVSATTMVLYFVNLADDTRIALPLQLTPGSPTWYCVDIFCAGNVVTLQGSESLGCSAGVDIDDPTLREFSKPVHATGAVKTFEAVVPVLIGAGLPSPTSPFRGRLKQFKLSYGPRLFDGITICHSCLPHTTPTICGTRLPCGHPCPKAKLDQACAHGLCLLPACTLNALELKSEATTLSQTKRFQLLSDICVLCFRELALFPCVQTGSCGHLVHYPCFDLVKTHRPWTSPEEYAHPRTDWKKHPLLVHSPFVHSVMFHSFVEQLVCPVCQCSSTATPDTDFILKVRHSNRVFSPKPSRSLTLSPNPKLFFSRCERCHDPYAVGTFHPRRRLPFVLAAGFEVPIQPMKANSPYSSNEIFLTKCTHCAWMQTRTCPTHGDNDVVNKCRYCCSIATVYDSRSSLWVCLDCLQELPLMTGRPLSAHRQCPGIRRQMLQARDMENAETLIFPQLKSSPHECPLGIEHPPNGLACSIGCASCLPVAPTYQDQRQKFLTKKEILDLSCEGSYRSIDLASATGSNDPLNHVLNGTSRHTFVVNCDDSWPFLPSASETQYSEWKHVRTLRPVELGTRESRKNENPGAMVYVCHSTSGLTGRALISSLNNPAVDFSEKKGVKVNLEDLIWEQDVSANTHAQTSYFAEFLIPRADSNTTNSNQVEIVVGLLRLNAAPESEDFFGFSNNGTLLRGLPENGHDCPEAKRASFGPGDTVQVKAFLKDALSDDASPKRKWWVKFGVNGFYVEGAEMELMEEVDQVVLADSEGEIKTDGDLEVEVIPENIQKDKTSALESVPIAEKADVDLAQLLAAKKENEDHDEEEHHEGDENHISDNDLDEEKEDEDDELFEPSLEEGDDDMEGDEGDGDYEVAKLTTAKRGKRGQTMEKTIVAADSSSTAKTKDKQESATQRWRVIHPASGTVSGYTIPPAVFDPANMHPAGIFDLSQVANRFHFAASVRRRLSGKDSPDSITSNSSDTFALTINPAGLWDQCPTWRSMDLTNVEVKPETVFDLFLNDDGKAADSFTLTVDITVMNLPTAGLAPLLQLRVGADSSSSTLFVHSDGSLSFGYPALICTKPVIKETQTHRISLIGEELSQVVLLVDGVSMDKDPDSFRSLFDWLESSVSGITLLPISKAPLIPENNIPEILNGDTCALEVRDRERASYSLLLCKPADATEPSSNTTSTGPAHAEPKQVNEEEEGVVDLDAFFSLAVDLCTPQTWTTQVPAEDELKVSSVDTDRQSVIIIELKKCTDIEHLYLGQVDEDIFGFSLTAAATELRPTKEEEWTTVGILPRLEKDNVAKFTVPVPAKYIRIKAEGVDPLKRFGIRYLVICPGERIVPKPVSVTAKFGLIRARRGTEEDQPEKRWTVVDTGFCLTNHSLSASTTLSRQRQLSKTQSPRQILDDMLFIFGGSHSVSGHPNLGGFANGRVAKNYGPIDETNRYVSLVYALDLRAPLIGSPVCVGFMPRKLEKFSVARYGEMLWIFGGVDENEIPSNTLWSFNPLTGEFTAFNCWDTQNSQTDSMQQVWPSPRFNHAAAVIDDHLFICGGEISKRDSSLWCFSFHTFKWHPVTIADHPGGLDQIVMVPSSLSPLLPAVKPVPEPPSRSTRVLLRTAQDFQVGRVVSVRDDGSCEVEIEGVGDHSVNSVNAKTSELFECPTSKGAPSTFRPLDKKPQSYSVNEIVTAAYDGLVNDSGNLDQKIGYLAVVEKTRSVKRIPDPRAENSAENSLAPAADSNVSTLTTSSDLTNLPDPNSSNVSGRLDQLTNPASAHSSASSGDPQDLNNSNESIPATENGPQEKNELTIDGEATGNNDAIKTNADLTKENPDSSANGGTTKQIEVEPTENKQANEQPKSNDDDKEKEKEKVIASLHEIFPWLDDENKSEEKPSKSNKEDEDEQQVGVRFYDGEFRWLSLQDVRPRRRLQTSLWEEKDEYACLWVSNRQDRPLLLQIRLYEPQGERGWSATCLEHDIHPPTNTHGGVLLDEDKFVIVNSPSPGEGAVQVLDLRNIDSLTTWEQISRLEWNIIRGYTIGLGGPKKSLVVIAQRNIGPQATIWKQNLKPSTARIQP